MAGGENGDAAGIHSHNGVYRFAAGDRMVLVYPQPRAAPLVNDSVGIAQCAFFRAFRRQRLRCRFAGPQRVEPLIRKIGEVENAVRYGPGSAAVFVNSGARIKRGWKNVHSRASTDHHAAARFLRTRFEPIYVATVEADFRESYRLGNNEVRSDGR